MSAIRTIRKYVTWAELVRAERSRCGFSQYEFAAKLGVSRAVVAHWERGDNATALSTVARFADFLSLSISVTPRRGPWLRAANYTKGVDLMVFDIPPHDEFLR